MTSRTTKGFRDLLSALPVRIQRQAKHAYLIFRRNPAHPSLHFKLIHADRKMYSARVGINYRAVGRLIDDTVIRYWIGSHADYDKLITVT